MPKLKPSTVVSTAAEDAAITAAARQDPDAVPYIDDNWAKIRSKRTRGRPGQDVSKVPISIRLNALVVDAFEAAGEGWQTRTNEALSQYARQEHLLSSSKF